MAAENAINADSIALVRAHDIELWRRLKHLIDDLGLAHPLSPVVDLFEQEHPKWESIRDNLKSTHLRNAVEEVLDHVESEVGHELIGSVFPYDRRVDDLIPFPCIGVDFDGWAADAAGKHRTASFEPFLIPAVRR